MQAVIEMDTGDVVFYLHDVAAIDIRADGMRVPWIVPDVTTGTHQVVAVADNPDYAAGHWRYADGAWHVRDAQAWAVYVAERDAAAAHALATSLRAELLDEYERRCATISADYPASERESWPVQISEARTLQEDPAAPAPWIDAAAAARGLDRSDLAARIVALDNAYRTIHGALTGVRQRIEGDISMAGANLAALEQVDVAAGWPD